MTHCVPCTMWFNGILCEAAMSQIINEEQIRIQIFFRKFLNSYLNIIVKLRQGSGKDRQGMALKAKGLEA